VLDYTWSTAAAVALATSCALAVLVNLSQFACLGRFTAVSYQVRCLRVRLFFVMSVSRSCAFTDLSHFVRGCAQRQRCRPAGGGAALRRSVHRRAMPLPLIPRLVTPSRFTLLQVLGHSKTILVLLGGWLFLGDVITVKQAGGMVLAVAGMVGYGIASSQCAPLPALSAARTPSEERRNRRLEVWARLGQWAGTGARTRLDRVARSHPAAGKYWSGAGVRNRGRRSATTGGLLSWPRGPGHDWRSASACSETAAAAAAALTKAPNGASYSVGRGASADEEAALLAKEPGAAKALA